MSVDAFALYFDWLQQKGLFPTGLAVHDTVWATAVAQITNDDLCR
ncbi:hypothetical protein Xbed_00186 [Xenorhabdus beddingii]|uniref:Uncharacterized protein n=1 Tax=Xenorhabdus beddingii TaxID=40578 RepID=A0A1Y2SS40_9GAMM|nr:hypothetical protein Xbed_00186 [Xenorhabdus beddingii]